MNDAVRDFLSSRDFEALSGQTDAVAAILLIILLAEHELGRAYSPSGRSDVRVLDIAIAPLLAAFVLIVVVRALGLR